MMIEDQRYAMQRALDSQKTDKERNRLGQFSTPFGLAIKIVKYALSLTEKDSVKFLEPSIGTGVFYSALMEVGQIKKATGFEIDKHYFTPTSLLWKNYPICLINDDFLNYTPDNDYNLIIANPPYSRHHHIDTHAKDKLRRLVSSKYDISISGLASYYCYFMILSTLWLEEGGISCWLIPSEFMDVNYGRAIREFLTSKVELISIHRFRPEDLQFSDALVSSCVVTFRNSAPNSCIKLTTGSDLLCPEHERIVTIEEMRGSHKWSSLFEEKRCCEGGITLGTFFKVSRGISSGNNSFFILSKDKIERLGLPYEFFSPILPGPRYLTVQHVMVGRTNVDDKYLLYLLSCPLPRKILKDRYPSLYKYISDGEQQGVNQAYNCQRRDPWYKSELRRPAPIYMTYMGRGDNLDRMFRFILNDSDAIVSNSYLILYPREEYQYCFESQEKRQKIWTILNEIPKTRLVDCGRSYGGGLFKIEPKELESLCVPELEDVMNSVQGSLFD